tara:strand:+ start:206 stop:397 length:192 start_codon:yes stop_codon:yes gene_type:complete
MTKNLLNTYNLEYLAIDLDTTEKKENFKRTTGFKTVPQIYNGAGDHIGGYDELVEYLNRGKTP